MSDCVYHLMMVKERKREREGEKKSRCNMWREKDWIKLNANIWTFSLKWIENEKQQYARKMQREFQVHSFWLDCRFVNTFAHFTDGRQAIYYSSFSLVFFSRATDVVRRFTSRKNRMMFFFFKKLKTKNKKSKNEEESKIFKERYQE